MAGQPGRRRLCQLDPGSGEYRLEPEQALCLADPASPVDLAGAYYIIEAVFHALDRTVDNFRTGAGLEWGDHHACLFHGTERFFRAGYNAHLLGEWLPALDGVVAKLTAGAQVADVGCGHGASTLLMARAYPRSRFIGYDYHPESIRVAGERAREAGLENARFEVADATGYGERDFDLIAFFDCLHDMADPVGAARHARQALKPDGHCLWWNRSPATTSRTTSIRSAGSTTALPRRSACRCRWPAMVRRWARRPARRACAR